MTEFGEGFGTDALDLGYIIDALKLAILGAVIDYGLSFYLSDAGQGAEFGEAGGVQVDHIGELAFWGGFGFAGGAFF